jgi:DNA-binding NarL/FixJ family response regulator
VRARILIVDDHEVVREGLRALLEKTDGWSVCGEASNGRQAVELALESKPDLVVLDLGMPELNGLEAARRILKALPRCGLVALSAYQEEAVVRDVIAAGVRGYVLKSESARDLVLAVQSVLEGRPFFSAKIADVVLGNVAGRPGGGSALDPPGVRLTGREREVLQLLAEGNSNKEVAATLGLGVKTTATHRANLMKKLGVRSVGDLVRYAVRNRVVEP